MAASDSIQPLQISSDSIATYNDWLSWKRSMLYYIQWKQIKDQDTKVAVFLHKAGRQLQEVWNTIETADPQSLADASEYKFEYLLEALDKHFKPTFNKFYERYLFRQIKQNSESFQQFEIRVRKQAANCRFRDQNDMICDQLLDGTSNPKFREQALEKGLDDLNDFVQLGKTLEAVSVQSKSMSSESSIASMPSSSSAGTSDGEVARLSASKNRSNQRKKSPPNRNRCSRCGSTRHTANDESCPAREATCLRCDRKGHYANRCRTKLEPEEKVENSSGGEKKSEESSSSKPKSSAKIRALDCSDHSDSSWSDDNVFRLKATPNVPWSNRVPLSLGGVRVEPIIDSGADANLLDPATWRSMCRRHVKYEPAPCDDKIFPYGRKEALRFSKAVWLTVRSASVSSRAKFFILADDAGDYETIVGRVLAVKLNVLRIGESRSQVCHLESNRSSSKLGKLTDVQLKIPIDPSVTPVAQPCRRIPFPIRKKLKGHLSDLVGDDIIEDVINEPTDWVSPIVPVIKKNGELRLCVDMRVANTAVRREKYPILTFEELIADMTDCTRFSRIDLKSAYNQVELDPESRRITTFITPEGIFRFKRLYCGIKCAPEIFQRLMTEVLQGLDNVRVFFDDIIVFSKSESEHKKHVDAVLKRLHDRGLTINLKKSTFNVEEIEFLGHILSKNCIKPNAENSEAIEKFEAPKNKKDLQSFLGLMNFVSRFVPNFSELSEPLRRLVHRNVVYRWSSLQEDAFQKLKKSIQGVKLGILDQNATIQVFADASPIGLGAVLLQKRPGMEKSDILAFASRSLSKAEQNYSQIEREALGLVWACERFRLYTLGKKFELYTDHKPLQFLFGPRSKPNARIERWVLRLQAFDFSINYIEGPKNIADSFSRLACSTPSKHSYAGSVRSTICHLGIAAVPKAIPVEEFDKESELDNELAIIRESLFEGTQLPTNYARFKYELTSSGNLVFRNDRLIPPVSLRQRCLTLAHEGHPGIDLMKRRLRSKVWWPGIDKDAEQEVRRCHSCLAVEKYNPPEPMVSSSLPNGPWEYVAIDFLGPLPDGRHVLVVVDYYSRFVEFQFTNSTSARITVSSLYRIFARFGFPARLKSDNAKAFVSDEFQNFLEEYGIQHITSPPLWPQSNGEVERQNKSFLKRLKIAALERVDLEIELAKYVLMYHGVPHPATGKSPADLMFHRTLRDKLPSAMQPSFRRDAIVDLDAEIKRKRAEYANSRRNASSKNLEVGSSVLLPAQKFNKLSPEFDPSPFKVISVSPGEVTVARGQQIFRRSSSAVKVLPDSLNSSLQAEDRGSLVTSTPFPVAPSLGASPALQTSPAISGIRSRVGRPVVPPRRLDL